MYKNIKIDVSSTPEKFQHMKDELVPFLMEVLEKLDEAESKAGVDTFEEYFRKCAKIILPVSVGPCDVKRTISNPPTYSYLNDSKSKIFFIMKSSKKAVIETYQSKNSGFNHQFILKNMENGWKIAEVKYGFDPGGPWYKYML